MLLRNAVTTSGTIGAVAAASCPECLIEGLGRRVFRLRFGID
jgi:4-hydroxy-3-methylbut-2-enyl diphosphate reductase IspH